MTELTDTEKIEMFNFLYNMKMRRIVLDRHACMIDLGSPHDFILENDLITALRTAMTVIEQTS